MKPAPILAEIRGVKGFLAGQKAGQGAGWTPSLELVQWRLGTELASLHFVELAVGLARIPPQSAAGEYLVKWGAIGGHHSATVSG